MSEVLNKLKQNYLTATQLALSQLQSSSTTQTVDPEFEKKYELCMNTKNSNFKMLSLVQKLIHQNNECIEIEKDLHQFLSRKIHRPKLQKTLDVVGRVETITSSEKNDQLTTLYALKEECEDLAEGGILDYCQYADQAEQARIAYSDALNYMKKTTENLNPEQYNHMNHFRQTQAIVREQKANFDDLQHRLDNLDTLINLREKVLTSFIKANIHAQLQFYDKTHVLCGSTVNSLLEYEHQNSSDETIISKLAEGSILSMKFNNLNKEINYTGRKTHVDMHVEHCSADFQKLKKVNPSRIIRFIKNVKLAD